jgi:hypothetical protein
VKTETPAWGIEPVPDRFRVLGLADSFLLWGNLGVSLLVLVAAAFLVPALSLQDALIAIVAGSLIGNLMLGAAGLIGADARVPGMVLLRAPLGQRGSYGPTALNVAQSVGWATFELIIIAAAAAALSDELFGFEAKSLWTIVFGAVAALLAFIGPVGVVRRVIRKFAVWIVLARPSRLLATPVLQGLPNPLIDARPALNMISVTVDVVSHLGQVVQGDTRRIRVESSLIVHERRKLKGVEVAILDQYRNCDVHAPAQVRVQADVEQIEKLRARHYGDHVFVVEVEDRRIRRRQVIERRRMKRLRKRLHLNVRIRHQVQDVSRIEGKRVWRVVPSRGHDRIGVVARDGGQVALHPANAVGRGEPRRAADQPFGTEVEGHQAQQEEQELE